MIIYILTYDEEIHFFLVCSHDMIFLLNNNKYYYIFLSRAVQHLIRFITLSHIFHVRLSAYLINLVLHLENVMLLSVEYIFALFISLIDKNERHFR